MKKLLVSCAMCLVVTGIQAQTTNYGLHLSQSSNRVLCERNQALESAPHFTIEAWVKIDNWVDGAQVLSNGPDLSLKLGKKGVLNFKLSQATATISHSSLTEGSWNLLTLSYDGTKAARLSAYVNAEEATVENSTSLPAMTSSTPGNFILGDGLIGWIDEVRVWKKALAKADIILKTTVSPYNNAYSDLSAYWKCDQFTSPGLVDYSGEDHHGQFFPDNTLRQPITDNTTLRYHPITSYVSLNAVAQGTLFDKHQLLPCNDIALFGLSVNADNGEAGFAYPDYTGTLTQAEYASTFTAPQTPQGAYETHNTNNQLERITRNEILKFKGAGASMDAGALNLNGKKVTFHTWLYVNNWTPETALFTKQGDNGDEISLKMGETEGQFIFTVSALFQGTRYTEVYPFQTTYKDADAPESPALTTSTMGDFQYWHFLSFVFDGTQKIPVSLAFDGFIQGWPVGGPNFVTVSKDQVTQNGEKMPVNNITGDLLIKNLVLPQIDGKMLIGKDLDGYMDEIAFWTVDRTKAQRQVTDALNVGLEIGKPGVYYTIQSLQAYYRILNETEPTKDYMSFKTLFSSLQDFLADYRGYKIRMSVTAGGTVNDWQAMVQNPELCKKAAESLADKLNNNPFNYPFAGIDIDFEWASSEATQVGYASFLKQLRENIGQDKLLSVASNGGSPIWYNFKPEALAAVDFFTSQDYGPHWVKFTYPNFLQMQANYEQGGIPKAKMMPSFGAYAVGDVYQQFDSTPYRAFAESVPDADTDRVVRNAAKDEWYNFTGINQTRKRAEFVVSNDNYGIMYYDLVCDILPTEAKSLTRSMAQVLPSNNELIVAVPNKVTVEDSGSVGNIQVSPASDDLVIYSRENKLVIHTTKAAITQISTISGFGHTLKLTEGLNEFTLPPGIYIVNGEKIRIR